MRKFRKLRAPNYLKENWKLWGKEWKNKYKNPARSNDFYWRCNVDDLIVNYLAKATQSHCSFCDVDNINKGAAATIEHFKPKSKYFRIAYQYNNLYNCCGECQKKNNRYEKRLLKPDLPSFEFDEYFEIELHTGKINPNPAKSIANREKAEVTIKLYRLNEGEKPNLRLKVLNNYIDERNNAVDPSLIDINKFSYRFFIEEYNRITP